MTRFVGKTKVMELMLTADLMDVKFAERFRLINLIVKQKELLKEANNMMDKILLNSSTSIEGVIKSVKAYFQQNKDGFLEETAEFKKCFTNGDFKEGVSAFLEKINPKFR